ncbi:MAG TPA: TolC family protein [Chitinophagales bacterium]|nr:TolC family protein [Chitinophagales bacterium]
MLFCFSANGQTELSTSKTGFTLQEALQIARVNNPVLKTEFSNIGIAQSELISAKLRSNPNLSNETLQLLQPSEFANDTRWINGYNREVTWQLSAPFQIAGQRKNKIDIANKSIDLEISNYAEVERNLFSEVAEKWLEIWIAQKQIDIIEIAKKNIDSLVLTNQIRYKNQVITQTDLFRTELLAKQYALQYKSAQQELINLLKEFQLVLGINETANIDINDNFIFDNPPTLDNLLNQSLQERSDVIAAKSMIDVSNSNIKLQKSLAYPQPEIGVLWNPQNKVQYFGISAAIDLPFFSRNQGEIKKSFIIKEQAENHLYTVQNFLKTEIETAYDSYQLQQQNIENYEAVLIQSNIILENVKYAYLKSGTTIIDYLEAQRSWLETQQQYYDALFQYRQSYVQLLSATGLINQLAQ